MVYFNVASTIGMAKDSTQWFHHASRWLSNSKLASTPTTSPPITKNPSFIIKQYPNSESALRACFLHVDGAWKEGKLGVALVLRLVILMGP